MKRPIILLSAIITLVISTFLLHSSVQAQTFESGPTVNLSQAEPLRDSVFAAGDTVDISTEVFGDVYCAGQTVTISAPVHGDVLCAAQTLLLNARVDGDIRLAAQTVTLNGDVGGNATVFAQSFTLSPNARIGGDSTIAATTATLNGNIGRDVIAGTESLVVGGVVGRNIKAGVDDLQLAASADVRGSIDYTSPRDLQRAEGAQVAGEVRRSDPPRQTDDNKLFGFSLAFLIYALLAMLVTSLILALLFPVTLHALTGRFIPNPLMALLVGFVTSIVLPILLIGLAITGIGLPLAILGGLFWLLAILLSGPVFAYYLGRIILRGQDKPLLIMLLGAVLLLLLYMIPFVNILVLLAVYWMGTGMILIGLYDVTPRPRLKLAAQKK